MSNPEVTKRMMDCVELVRDRAKRAEQAFDSANSRIQSRASYTIDIFGGDATSRVADIARDARRACDDLYTSYQSLIRTLDETCRPLLSQDPDLRAVREVRDLIKWLNDESEIENNFTASFNGRNLGDVASGRYVPSMECKMIQRYWEDKYDLWPGRAEAEAKARAEEAERRRIAAEARKKREEEERKQAEAQMEVYKKEYAAWEQKKNELEIKRRQEVEERLAREVADKKEQLKRTYREKKDAPNGRLAAAQERKKQAEETLASLGFFAFGAKKENKQIIRETTEQIAQIEGELAMLDRWNRDQHQKIDTTKGKRKKELEQAAERKYPIPPAPRKPRMPLSTSFGGAEPTPVMIANRAIQQDILDHMEPGVLYTITDIQQMVPSCEDLTNQRVSALIRQLVPDQIERVEERRMAYFRLAE